MKGLMEFLALPLSLPINPIANAIICLILGELAFRAAYSLAGRYGSSKGERTILHWLIRIPIFFVSWFFTYGMIRFIKFIKANWQWFLVVLGGLVFIRMAMFIVYRNRVTER